MDLGPRQLGASRVDSRKNHAHRGVVPVPDDLNGELVVTQTLDVCADRFEAPCWQFREIRLRGEAAIEELGEEYPREAVASGISRHQALRWQLRHGDGFLETA